MENCVTPHRTDLQAALADRALLQVNQAEPQDKNLPRNLEERPPGAGVDGDDLLSVAFLYQVHEQDRAEPNRLRSACKRRADDADESAQTALPG